MGDVCASVGEERFRRAYLGKISHHAELSRCMNLIVVCNLHHDGEDARNLTGEEIQ